MKSIVYAAAALALVAGSAASAAPDPHGNHGRPQPGNQHPGWGRDQGNQHRWNQGERMGYNDWRGARPVDYRRYRLRQPPRGYEWRQQGNQFILAAVATGLIASIVASR